MRSLFRRTCVPLGVVTAAILIAGCSDSTSSLPPEVVSTTRIAEAEATAFDVGRGLALALSDEAIRSGLREDIARLGVTEERKLELNAYLNRSEGTALSNRIADVMGASTDELRLRVSKLPPLELYMPVPSHRERWEGGDNLLVAVHLDEDAEPVGFDLRGSRLTLGLEEAPETPTLVLVPVETNFSRAEPARVGIAENDDGFVRFASSSLSAPMLMQAYPPGIYFNYMRVHDDNEPWTKGNPEIEVHLSGSRRGILNVVNTQPNFFPCVSGLPCLRPGYPNDPTSVALSQQRWITYYPNLFDDRFIDCAGAQESGIRSFNFEGTGHHYKLTLFGEEEDFVISEFMAEGDSAFGTRQIPVEPPFEISILERDDGKECPTPGLERQVQFNIDLVRLNGTLDSYQAVSAIDSDDFSWLWGGGNDLMARWVITTYAGLENASNLYLDESDSVNGDDADLRILNIGFAESHLPPWQQYYPPIVP